MTLCSDGDSLLLRSPSRDHMGVREGEGGGQGCDRRTREVVGGGCGGWLVDVLLCISSSKSPPLYSGRGCTLPLHQGSQEVMAKGRSKAAAD
jgi:hypothetical protein